MLTQPHTGVRLAALHRRIATLRALRRPEVSGFCARVRDLVIIASSSRGGSSMLAEVLRESDALSHLRAEINPFLRLAGLAYPDSGSGSDRLDGGHLEALPPYTRRMLDEELALDAGNPAATVTDDHRFGLDVAWRLTVQWPSFDWEPEDIAVMAIRTLDLLRREADATGRTPSWRRFQRLLVEDLRAAGFPVDLSFYDRSGPKDTGGTDGTGDTGCAEGSGEDGAPAGGPPGDLLVEEPPFVLPRAWRHAGAEDAAARPLVIKTPSNAYRLDFLRALFPNARLHVVHLTRNPAASINGLYDGWRYHGFHAHRMAEPLNVTGYVDHRPQDRHWWKFDLPPGWQEFTNASLPEVCAFQWRSCHAQILDDIDGVEYTRIRFEDLIGPPAARAAAFTRLADRLEVPLEGAFRRAAFEGIAPVAATAPPSPGRWRERAEMIDRCLDAQVRSVAEELGYATDDGWI